MPTCRVLDLSHHNSVPKDFKAAKAEGVIGVIHKLTEGTGYTDDKVQARSYLATDAGLLWGLYHFLRPTGSMQEQANFFLDQAENLGVIDDDTVLVADHEDEGVSGEHLKEFLDAVEDRAMRSPVIYSGHVLKEQLAGSGYRPKRRLWLCQYASTPVLPEGVDAYWLWQYTDAGSCGGISPVDCNHFEGPDEPFIAGWAGRYDQPVPPDDIENVMVEITAPPGVKVTVKVKEA